MPSNDDPTLADKEAILASLNIKAMTFDDTIGELCATVYTTDTPGFPNTFSYFVFFGNAGVLSQRGPEFDNMNTAGSPIVLQRRGSVYGANVPMITGIII